MDIVPRRKMGLDDAIEQQRVLDSAAKRAPRIFRKKSAPVKPFAALDEIKSKGPEAKKQRAFEQSQAPIKRAARVKDAKDNGTFNAIRERFNTANAGRDSMDEDGNIGGSYAKANPPPAKPGSAFNRSQAPAQREANVAKAKASGEFENIRSRYNKQYEGKYSMDKDGNVGTSNSSPSASKKADTATPPKAKTPLPPTIARPADQAEAPKPTPRPTSGVIRDETGDITSKIQGRLAEKRKPMMPAATPAVAAQPAAPKAQTAGEMMAEVDGAIAKNKDAVSALNKSFAKKPQVSQAEKSLGKPVVDNLDKGSNYVPYTKGEPQSRSKKIRMDFIDRETSKRTPAPSPSTLAKSGGVGTESKTAPAGGWGKLAKDNFDKSMAADFGRVAKREAGEAVDAVGKAASAVGGAVKSGYAAAGMAMKPAIDAVKKAAEPSIQQAKTNFSQSDLGKFMESRSKKPRLAKN